MLSIIYIFPHLIINILIFCLITGTIANLTYLPYLVLIAILAGVIVGFTLYTIIKIIPNRVLDKIT